MYWKCSLIEDNPIMVPGFRRLTSNHVHIQMWFVDQYGTGCHLCQTILWLEVFTCTRVGYICMFIKVLKVMHLVAFSLSHPHTLNNVSKTFFILMWYVNLYLPPSLPPIVLPCLLSAVQILCHCMRPSCHCPTTSERQVSTRREMEKDNGHSRDKDHSKAPLFQVGIYYPHYRALFPMSTLHSIYTLNVYALCIDLHIHILHCNRVENCFVNTIESSISGKIKISLFPKVWLIAMLFIIMLKLP